MASVAASIIGTTLAVGGVPLGIGAGVIGYEAGKRYIQDNYGPKDNPVLSPGQSVVHTDGKEYKVIGYSGHDGDIAHNLNTDTIPVYITPDLSIAQGYAGNAGKVAILASEKSMQPVESRYENMHGAYKSQPGNKLVVLHVEPLHENNDKRFETCLKRLACQKEDKSVAYVHDGPLVDLFHD